jgi:hypothetical protein
MAMATGPVARYDSRPWSGRAGAAREWVLEVEELGAIDGRLGDGQVLPDRLLSVAGTGVDATKEQRAALARLELGAVTEWQMRFEAVVQAGFARQVASAPDLASGRVTFLLHEIGEEAGHQRLFQRLVPSAPDPAAPALEPIPAVFDQVWPLAMRFPAVLYALVLAGEEILDRFQEDAADDPATDPFVREVYAFHRMEEANHVAFVQAVYAEAWVRASRVERAVVRQVVPRLIGRLFDAKVRPGDYEKAGLPSGVWGRVRHSDAWTSSRATAARPVLDALVDVGALRRSALPRPWRQLCRLENAAPGIPG